MSIFALRAFQRLQRAFLGHRFGLAAFLIPLGIRTIPEILVGPYPVGFDTIAFYVPNTLDWAAGKAGFLEMLGTAPLMYMMAGLVLARVLGWENGYLRGLEKNV